ncbi:MAG: hypothetical protein KJ886_01305 [Candidatus Thermoplasmatota archaeon]|nr:hypothetical protein [Candidatus Thermoplasmatota archaeon]MCG2825808.1 hypothetical protein [Thermoplasmatales archaeon]
MSEIKLMLPSEKKTVTPPWKKIVTVVSVILIMFGCIYAFVEYPSLGIAHFSLDEGAKEIKDCNFTSVYTTLSLNGYDVSWQPPVTGYSSEDLQITKPLKDKIIIVHLVNNTHINDVYFSGCVDTKIPFRVTEERMEMDQREDIKSVMDDIIRVLGWDLNSSDIHFDTDVDPSLYYGHMCFRAFLLLTSIAVSVWATYLLIKFYKSVLVALPLICGIILYIPFPFKFFCWDFFLLWGFIFWLVHGVWWTILIFIKKI